MLSTNVIFLIALTIFTIGEQMPDQVLIKQLQNLRSLHQTAVEIDIGDTVNRYASGLNNTTDLELKLKKEGFYVYRFDDKGKIFPTCKDADRLAVATVRIESNILVSNDEAIVLICSKNGIINELKGKIYSMNL